MKAQATRVGTSVAALLVLLAARDGTAQPLAGRSESVFLNGWQQAVVAPPAGSGGSWSRVQKLEAGREVIVGVSGRQPLKYTLLAADGNGLVLLKPTEQTLDRAVKSVLVAVGSAWPEVLAGRPTTMGDFEINSGGIYRGGRKLMDLATVVERVDRAAITEVRGPHTKSAGDPNAHVGRQKGLMGALIGGAGGFVLGLVAGAPVCGESDSGECPGILAAGGAIGAGIGALVGGLVGSASQGDDHDTFYVARPGPPPTLDELPWERLRLALPPSLQGASRPPSR
jgi:hypothetical protein